MGLPKKSGLPKAIPVPQNQWEDPVFKRDYPTLYAFLHDQKFDDGSLRVPGSMSIFCQMGVLKCCLNDKHAQMMTFLEASTWDELVALADSAILDDGTDWKAMKNKPPF